MRNKKMVKKTIQSILFLAPCAVVFFVFVIMPFLQGIPYSFRRWDGFSADYTIVGLENYKNVLTDGSIAAPAVNTIKFAAMEVVFSNLFGLLLALGISRNSRFHRILRTIYFMPYVISIVLASYIWSYIFSDVCYSILGMKNLLASPKTVILGLAIISVWKDTGYCMIVFLAALKSVPDEYYEVARVEGSKSLHTFVKITLPLIVPAFTTNATLVLSWGLKVFEYPMVTTGGGPGTSSESLAMYIYKNIFVYYKAGYGQAAAILFTLFLAVISFLVASFFRSREVEV